MQQALTQQRGLQGGRLGARRSGLPVARAARPVGRRHALVVKAEKMSAGAGGGGAGEGCAVRAPPRTTAARCRAAGSVGQRNALPARGDGGAPSGPPTPWPALAQPPQAPAQAAHGSLQWRQLRACSGPGRPGGCCQPAAAGGARVQVHTCRARAGLPWPCLQCRAPQHWDLLAACGLVVAALGGARRIRRLLGLAAETALHGSRRWRQGLQRQAGSSHSCTPASLLSACRPRTQTPRGLRFTLQRPARCTPAPRRTSVLHRSFSLCRHPAPLAPPSPSPLPPLWRTWWALTWAPPTARWRPWRAASPPSSPTPRAAAPRPPSSPSPRPATASWARWALAGLPCCCAAAAAAPLVRVQGGQGRARVPAARPAQPCAALRVEPSAHARPLPASPPPPADRRAPGGGEPRERRLLTPPPMLHPPTRLLPRRSPSARRW